MYSFSYDRLCEHPFKFLLFLSSTTILSSFSFMMICCENRCNEVFIQPPRKSVEFVIFFYICCLLCTFLVYWVDSYRIETHILGHLTRISFISHESIFSISCFIENINQSSHYAYRQWMWSNKYWTSYYIFLRIYYDCFTWKTNFELILK